MKEKPVVGIATDGAHSAKERLTRFRAVDLSSGKELFSKAIGNWTNNIGEFLGIVEAVRYVMEHPESPRTIYSDSITAITWYRNKQTASSRRCPALQKAEIFLKVMEARIKDIEVLHWVIRLVGVFPAVFGFFLLVVFGVKAVPGKIGLAAPDRDEDLKKTGVDRGFRVGILTEIFIADLQHQAVYLCVDLRKGFRRDQDRRCEP